MPAPSTAQPNSSVSQFETGDPEAQDVKEGADYSDPDSSGEPSVMISSAQADAAGMTDAKPGDSFTIKVTITDQTDDGWNIELEPGSAMKDAGPSEEPLDMPAKRSDKIKLKGPGDLGMPSGLGQSPTILNA
jgi:hypothetical protein